MLQSILTAEITIQTFLICTVVSILLGLGTACVHLALEKTTSSFTTTIVILPAVVQVVIMLVNGHLGAGIAVAGTFSLVRFRSAPGTAQEIGTVFLAMAMGLATGMGYLTLAILFSFIMAAILLLLNKVHFGAPAPTEKILRIVIPENLDYDGLFDDLFKQHLKSYTLEKVKTTNLGSLYELQYQITLKDQQIPKALLDEIRCRNGNLTVACYPAVNKDQL